MEKSKLNEVVKGRQIYYYLLIDDKLVVRTASKETLIEQYEFQRSIMLVSIDRITIHKEVHLLFELNFQ